jgi:uncharacterized UPF0160 family protein
MCFWRGSLLTFRPKAGSAPRRGIYEIERRTHVPHGQDEKGNWRIQCVSVSPGSFENRRSLPAAWRGLRDAELDDVTGQPGGIFVHAAGFIGGHKTVEGATAMAIAALNLE